MAALQDFLEKLFCEGETSDHERSILLVDIMNAIGFSKREREIHRHRVHLHNVLVNIFKTSGPVWWSHDNKIMISYSHIDISSYPLHVQKLLTTLHCYC